MSYGICYVLSLFQIRAVLDLSIKSSYSRALTSVLRAAFDVSVLGNFKWCGQQRGGQKKKSLSDLKIVKLLMCKYFSLISDFF